MVELLLKHGADPNNVFDHFKSLTVLHQAVRKNNRDLVKVLLDHGASTSGEDKQGRTAVEYSEDRSMINLLIKHSLSKGKACGRDLICAANFCKVNLIRRLIAIGIDVNSRDSRGNTALIKVHELADDHFDTPDDDIHDDGKYEKRGSKLVKTLKVLLRAGADPCIPDDDLRTPSNSMHSCDDELLDLYDNHVESIDREWPTELQKAVAIGDLDAVEQLLSDEDHASHIDAGDSHDFTAMHYAILGGRGDREKIVKHLIDKNADPNIPDVYGRTPLHYAVALRGQSIPLIEMILSAGGSLDTKDQLSRRPVDIAIVHTRMEIYHMLTKIQKSRMGDVVDDDVPIFDLGGP